MNGEKILKSTQEQASAAWIDWLNQLRLNKLINALLNQDINLENALKELEKLKDFIAHPEHILGKDSTKHGEIAEHVQVNISNARKLLENLKTKYTFENVGRTASVDYIYDGSEIQSKFYNGLKNTLTKGIKNHLEKYPNFVKGGGKYVIPKDQYNEAIKLLEMSKLNPSSLSKSDWKTLRVIKEFQKNTGLDFAKDIKPAIADYKSVQLGKINEFISNEEKNIKEIDKEKRKTAYERSKPTLKEGAKATVVSAAFEGGVSFCMAIRKKLKSGKKLHEFTEEDWKDIGLTMGIDTAKGGIRGAVVYTLSNFTATPANVASALVTAAFGVVSQSNELRKGNIDNEEFIINSETVCLDVSISAIASILGQTVIPIPVLGAIIGNVSGMFMYDIAKNCYLEKEQEYIKSNNIAMTELNKQLDEEYRQLVELITEKFKEFKSAVELAFDVDINIAFEGSIRLAELVGVDSNKILRNQEDVYNYFTI